MKADPKSESGSVDEPDRQSIVNLDSWSRISDHEAYGVGALSGSELL